MKVFLDDERPTPTGWIRVWWPDEAIRLLEAGDVTEISLDHDLGDDARGTGYDVIRWMEEAVALRGFVPPVMHVHSANTAARERMRLGIESINRLAAKNRPSVEREDEANVGHVVNDKPSPINDSPPNAYRVRVKTRDEQKHVCSNPSVLCVEYLGAGGGVICKGCKARLG